jgi:radical SAM/Cys-rich protein
VSTIGLTISGRNAFDEAVGGELRGTTMTTVQVNIGLTCNLACHHCHVESSPKRTEQMSRATMEQVLSTAARIGATMLDITGGAPEMNPNFRWFMAQARERGLTVMVRTNLTILLEDGYTDLPDFFRTHRAHLVASMPCYLEQNVDKQRGRRVYAGSIEAIHRLNSIGYGIRDELPLDLVYNPLGPSLPPDPAKLETDYRRELRERFGLSFTRLVTITNMPVGRFLHDLKRDGKADQYAQLLRDSFNNDTVEELMCRHQLHISHDGTLYDCDFNYALGLSCGHLSDFDPAAHVHRRIVTGEHCFGCTAGRGSSCGGALVS